MIGVGTYRTSEKARKYINQVLDSERLSYGPFTQKFERVFASAHDCRFAVMSNSGTSCLMVALAALKEKYDWQDGDEVIVPAVTFIATSNIVLQLNMVPVFVDVEPEYYGIDPRKIEAAITSKTRCIIPVHLFGMPCEMDSIKAIAEKHKLRIIEDSCETMFARYKGQSVGSFGDVGCFSTYVAHLLITGVGGLCTINDPNLAVTIRSIVNHGRDSIYISIDDDKNKSKDELRMIVARRFSFVRMGYSFRVTEFEGALGLAEFEGRQKMLEKRRSNGAYLTERLTPLENFIQLPKIRPGAGHSFMMYPIVLRNERKENFVNYLESRGIETRDMLPLTNQPYYKNHLKIDEDQFPVAKWINNSGFYIACHQDLTDAEKSHIVRCFYDYFAGRDISYDKSTLIVMSKLAPQQYDEVFAQGFIENLPLSSFDELILADGAFNDKLTTQFQKAGFKIVQEQGTKSAIFLKSLALSKNENVVVVGIDGTDNMRDIDTVLINLQKGHDIVVESRFIQGGRRAAKGFLTHRSFGNRFFSLLVSMMFSKNISDVNNLFRGFKRSSILKLNLSPKSEEVMFEMTVRALEEDLKIIEIPTVESMPKVQVKKRSRLLSAMSLFVFLVGHFFRKGQKLPLDDYADLSAPTNLSEGQKKSFENQKVANLSIISPAESPIGSEPEVRKKAQGE